jgi:hypothetical protein
MNAKQRALRLPDYLAHMLAASQVAQSYVEGIAKPEFLSNRMIQQAVVFNSAATSPSVSFCPPTAYEAGSINLP